MKRRLSFWRVLFALILILVSSSGIPVRAALSSPAEILLQSMTPEEKVGQLFLVTFEGTAVDEESEIYDLITNRHIGGVILLAKNDNFSGDDTLTETRKLIKELQEIEWENSAEERLIQDTGNVYKPAYVPLFVGIPQIGNGPPSDQLMEGVTQLPSHMALGATWDTELAAKVGEVLGNELSDLGFNLFLGPNLDVLETANTEAANYLGVNTFGGDPFWVGEMGKAFISGLHLGSENRMLVVAQNFPGTGNSDRLPDDEVATVRKSLEQLKQIELAPFFTVTRPDFGDPGRIDALMVSHIRYQGFQGNIRATTKPISFDSNALQQIMSLPEFEAWRTSGGLIISDNLGSGAVRRFFDPNEVNFEAWQVARTAFLAGNDMLYSDHLIATGDPDPYSTLLNTLDFFAQKYREDSAFAKRVDSSVIRILEAKMGLWGEFSLANVIPQFVNDEIGTSKDVAFEVAQNAVTLISPEFQELDVVLPSPPIWQEDIVIFTDVRSAYQCTDCPPHTVLTTNSLSNALINLYGPQAGGQLIQNKISSFTFSQLVEVLDNIENESTESLSPALKGAEWVIFNVLDVNQRYPESNALQRILSERPDFLAGKKVIVFALDSPVYLDATNISKITAYYALYSKIPDFVDVAARVLMQEIDPVGALPVSLNAVGYDLILMTSPDPDQIITLKLVMPEPGTMAVSPEETPEVTQTPEPTPIPSFNIGDTITIQTGEIYDHNGNIVPDGTVVRFNFRISGEPGITQQFDTVTTAGVAYFNYRIEAAGGLEVSATSDPATRSEILQINIEPGGSAAITAISPTPEISPTPTETPTATPTDLPAPTATPEPSHGGFPTLGEWALGVIVMGFGSAMAYFIGKYWWGSSRWGLRSSLCALIGALIAYSYLNLGVGGTKYWLEKSGTNFVVEIVVVGLLIGWIGGLIWWMRSDGRYPSRKRQ